ncbi:hypothetical protein ABEW32_03440 [Paenibacillus jamilae]|uniref:hypothetical protein n=1 Tax=Paenibacillus TaxID=44249 RepID=UPI000FA891AE|nr:hypothetical protein [Paenibacillus sp. Lou8.1]MCP3810031.1 hypothetical protein [Paenibacillus sp. Lou8.1]
MDKHELTRKQLRKHYEQCHKSAMSFIEIVTNAAGDQMKIEGIEFDPNNISVEQICELAAKNLNADVIDLMPDYVELMEFEKMVVSVDRP